ncbi:hypothetical protein PRIPAC_74618 [Pristionchus pacificus]|nr:hypothetical protein PRIPAC_74618 [Pristionchus pacificus]
MLFNSTLRGIYSYCLHSLVPFPLSIFIDPMPPTASPLLDSLLDETIEMNPLVKPSPVIDPPKTSIPHEIRSSIRLPPPTQRKKPAAKDDIVQCSSVKKLEMVPLLILGEDGKLNKKSKIDFKTLEWRVNSAVQHHEIFAVDCHTGEVYKQVLSPETLFVMMNDEKYKENCKRIEAVSIPEEMQAIQCQDGNIIVSIPGINPPFSLDRLEGEQFTAYMLAEMEKEKNEQQEIREAERQRWNEVTQEDSYINLLRRELTSMRAA